MGLGTRLRGNTAVRKWTARLGRLVACISNSNDSGTILSMHLSERNKLQDVQIHSSRYTMAACMVVRNDKLTSK